jgi:hypothetical protein
MILSDMIRDTANTIPKEQSNGKSPLVIRSCYHHDTLVKVLFQSGIMIGHF